MTQSDNRTTESVAGSIHDGLVARAAERAQQSAIVFPEQVARARVRRTGLG